MATQLPVDDLNLSHCLLMKITINGLALPLYLSTGYRSFDFNDGTGTQTYTPLGGFLGISDIQNTLQNAADELTVTLTGIEDTYIAAILDPQYQVKGGSIKIYRAFLGTNGLPYTNTGYPTPATPTTFALNYNCFPRFIGRIVNYAINEEVDATATSTNITYNMSIICSSIFGVLENKVSGRRTNPRDYQIYYDESFFTAPTGTPAVAPIKTDPSMDNVQALFNANFDFGKKYTAPSTSTSGSANSGTNGRNTEQITDANG
jgi:hypothetical protein